MKKNDRIKPFSYSEICVTELTDIRAGAAPLAVAAIAVAAAKLVLDASYCVGYAVGYIQGSID